MRYGSVCSGIEAATVAWHSLGWEPAFFSEIDPFPCAVLSDLYGSNLPGEQLARNGVPNLGDMTLFEEWPDFVGSESIDLPKWFLWENVPGVLSSNHGRDFGRFLGELTGRAVEVPGGGWKNAGLVAGIPDAYGVSWCVRDAQFTRTRQHPRAVPQRRRRVFVVGYLGDWRRAAAVLFDGESLCGNPAPRREAGASVAALTSNGVGTCGADDNQAQGGHLVAHCLRAEGFDASEDGTGRATPIVPVAFDSKGTQVQAIHDGSAPTLRAMGHAGSHQNAGGQIAVAEKLKSGPQSKGYQEGLAYTLEARNNVQSVATELALRRLTPRECERLQGFPDDYTRISWRGKDPENCPDGKRYKALGNSMAVNVMRSLGERIALVDGMIGGVAQ